MLPAVPAPSLPSMMTWMMALKIDPIMAVITQIDSGAGNLSRVAAYICTSDSALIQTKWQRVFILSACTCRTVLQAKTVTPVSRYTQPRTQSLSIFMPENSRSLGTDCGTVPGSGFFRKLTHIAPLMHTNVPKIFALVHLHLHSNLSNLHIYKQSH